MHFPPEAAEIRPAVVFGNSLFPWEECANAVVSVRGNVSILPVVQVTDKGVAMIPPVTDRHVQRMVSRSSAGAHIVYDCAYCTLMVQRIYMFYEADLWIVRGWIIGILLAGTRVSWILGLYRYVMIALV